MAGGRWFSLLGAGAAVACLVGVAACGAEPEPGQLSPARTSTAPTSMTGPTAPSGPASTPAPSPSEQPSLVTATSSPSTSQTLSGISLRQLGFEHGPLDEFTLPSDVVLTTRVDQPNAVTLVLARPSPETVEDYLRATLPGEGFRIDARSAAGGAMTFAGNGWTGGFTGTGATSAIVLRPES